MRRNPYYLFLTPGGAVALLLSVIGALAPLATRGWLPLGGTDFHQTAITLLFALVVAIIIDLMNGGGPPSAQ